MTPVFRVAIIGCGAICGNHISAILGAGHTVCALCDIVPARTQTVIERFSLGNIPVYTDYKAMLLEQRPDAVHICTPHDLHAPMAIDALEQNIHVLCEKPLCISGEQMDALRTAVQNSRAQLGVCHQNRYESNLRLLYDMTRSDPIQSALGVVAWKRDAAYYASGAWRGTWAHEGGGVMINQALHTLDLLQWVCGMPTHVTARISNDTLARDAIEVEDTATARFDCADGTVFTVLATVAAGADFPVEIQVKLKSNGLIRAGHHLITKNHKPISCNSEGAPLGKYVWGKGHGLLIKEFYDCIAQDRRFPIDFEEGIKVVKLILAMYRSNGTRTEI